MATEYGKRLRQARKHAKLTQDQLSEKTGIPQSTISTAEREGYGSSETPVYADKCGVNALWLATGEGEMLGNYATLTLPSFTSETSGDPPIHLETAIERVALHFESLGDYDRGTAVALMTTLARSPYMHVSVSSGLVEMAKRAREDPENKPQPVFSRAAA